MYNFSKKDESFSIASTHPHLINTNLSHPSINLHFYNIYRPNAQCVSKKTLSHIRRKQHATVSGHKAAVRRDTFWHFAEGRRFKYK